MAYDSSKDKTYWETTLQSELRIAVCSYNGGERKVRFNRVVERNRGMIFSQAGGITKKELDDFQTHLPEVQKALNGK